MPSVIWSRMSLSPELAKLESILQEFGNRNKEERGRGYYSAERTGREQTERERIELNSNRFLVLVCS